MCVNLWFRCHDLCCCLIVSASLSTFYYSTTDCVESILATVFSMPKVFGENFDWVLKRKTWMRPEAVLKLCSRIGARYQVALYRKSFVIRHLAVGRRALYCLVKAILSWRASVRLNIDAPSINSLFFATNAFLHSFLSLFFRSLRNKQKTSWIASSQRLTLYSMTSHTVAWRTVESSSAANETSVKARGQHNQLRHFLLARISRTKNTTERYASTRSIERMRCTTLRP